jgi:hypothetical protein
MKKQRIIIEFTKQTSEADIEDLKILIDDISKKYNFHWSTQIIKEEK